MRLTYMAICKHNFGDSWPLCIVAKGRGHEIVRTLETSSEGCTMKIWNWWCGHGPSSVLLRHRQPNSQPYTISSSSHSCGPSHTSIKELWDSKWHGLMVLCWIHLFIVSSKPCNIIQYMPYNIPCRFLYIPFKFPWSLGPSISSV